MKVMILHYFWNSKPFEKVISNCSRRERLWKETDIRDKDATRSYNMYQFKKFAQK